MKIQPLTIRGRDFEVWLDDDGDFTAQYENRTYRSKTRDGLREALMKVTKQAATKVAVPVLRSRGHLYSEPRLEEAVITGIHAGTGNVLVKSYGKTEQAHHFDYDRFYRPMTDAEKAEFLEAWRAWKTAQDRWEALRRERQIDVRKLAREAVDAAMASVEVEEPQPA